MRLRDWIFAAAVAVAMSAGAGVAARPAAPLAADPAVEQRMASIAGELRCLVCQNESLAASRADLAEDLRREIREQIRRGRSDAEIMDFMVVRYGDFVRYRPPLKASTWLLWFGPFLMLAAGTLGLLRFVRRRRRDTLQAPLSSEEHARAVEWLGQEK